MRVSLRFEVFKRDAFTCRYCGLKSPEAILEVDHVMPVSGGGLDELENLVTSCFSCNRGKGASLLTEIPTESNVHDKAILIAERELQIEALTYWRARQRKREDAELAQLSKFWNARYFSSKHWKESRARTFLRALGFMEVAEVLEYTVDHAQSWGNRGLAESAWILFCSMCTKRSSLQANGREE